MQIFLHRPITLKIDNSKNVKVINGTKKFLGENLTLKEIFEVMRGRNAFESYADFESRAKKITGVAVGTLLLDDKNYFYDAEIFKIKPQWNFDFISVLKNFANDREFFINLSPQNAELLYNNECKLQIFADFAYIDDKLTISNLYLETETLGRIIIESFIRSKNKISSGSGFRGLGYGLHIIKAYANCEGSE